MRPLDVFVAACALRAELPLCGRAGLWCGLLAGQILAARTLNVVGPPNAPGAPGRGAKRRGEIHASGPAEPRARVSVRHVSFAVFRHATHMQRSASFLLWHLPAAAPT